MDLTYVASALEPESWPKLLDPQGGLLPEIALAGRSNVGKSTFLNLLAGRPIAKVSSIPGKTQRIQFFQGDGVAIVDLPGYGYAKAPPKLQAEWSGATHAYLEKRPQLKTLLLLLDIRRTPSADDVQLLDWASQKTSLALVPVLTKTDLVSKSECERQTAKILEVLAPYTFSEIPLCVPAPKRIVWNKVAKLYAS